MAGPLTPPVGTRFSTGVDFGSLAGPTSAPAGAVTVTPGGTGLDTATNNNAAGTTFYLLAGTHVLGGGSPTAFSQVIPKAGNTYIGAPGAVLDGRSTNRYAFTGQAANVTIKYLEVINFVCLLNEFVVNHDAGSGWTVQFCNVHANQGCAIGIGIDMVIDHCWMHDNQQYGFSSYKPPVNAGAVSAITNVLIDHCEINTNGTLSLEYNPDGTPTGAGLSGAGKFWDTNGITVTNNWIHHSVNVGIWADTNNVKTHIEGNLIEENDGEGIFYEISYNFFIANNTLRRNAIYKGKNWASRSDNFPIASIYLSESGGDSAVDATYSMSSIDGNTFIDNWGDVTLWENADRFCNSLANTSDKVYKPKGHGASLAICNQPTTKTLTVNTSVGSPVFTVTAGPALESTDEGRSVSGSGIPTSTSIQAPAFPGDTVGFISSTQGRMTANATATATGVTMTVAAGTINTDPAYTACRWHTQHIRVQNNTFNHDSAAVLGGTTLPSGVVTGKIAVISQVGTFPSWSPYTGSVIQGAITFNQDNVWLNNIYAGPYTFMPHDTGLSKTFTQWQAAPYNQDVGSTFASTSHQVVLTAASTLATAATIAGAPPSGNPLWANIGGGEIAVTAIYANIGGTRVQVTNRVGG